MIDVDTVSVSFGETEVLVGVDLAVRQGELLGLVGPNGSGKTTLLRTINGLLAPDDGTVRVGGESIAALDARAVGRNVATVPQETHLRFAFTVRQVVEMGRTPHRSRLDWQDATAAVDRALDRTETTHLADRPVDELSGGERQRVLLARALAQEAPALVLDEPTASLDVNHQVRVLELVCDLVDDGRTAIAAIHDLDLAARYCDRLALLADGEFVAVGRPRDVLAADRVERAFGTPAVLGEDELTGTPRLTAVGTRPDRTVRVHVAGAGRQAARALGACWRAGFAVSVGLVPEGDATAALAADLDRPAATAPPFVPVDDATRDDLETLLARADVVVRAAADLDPVTAGAVPETTPVVDWSSTTGEPETLAGPTDAGARETPGWRAGPEAPGAVVDAVLDAVGGTGHADD